SPLALPVFSPPPATTEIYTLSLHDALPISGGAHGAARDRLARLAVVAGGRAAARPAGRRRARHRGGPTPHLPSVTRARGRPAHRSEEHTSELQSRSDLVCRLLLEKKNKLRQ